MKNGKLNFIRILFLVFVFLAGFILGQIFNFSFDSERITGFDIFSNKITGYAIEPPSDLIDDKNIIIYPDKVVILVGGARLNNYEGSGSMSPLFGKNSNGITIKPNSEDEIAVGDIVSFRKNDELIVHRVVEKGFDREGVYFITKGDNSQVVDGKIRFSEIEHVLIGVVY
ncbi:hypothetical protein HYV50_00710 [Candidatus Pacearchaeota archaeon]|nr:hypothetical protein [Candidatus Pacearchaeota archaeon]